MEIGPEGIADEHTHGRLFAGLAALPGLTGEQLPLDVVAHTRGRRCSHGQDRRAAQVAMGLGQV